MIFVEFHSPNPPNRGAGVRSKGDRGEQEISVMNQFDNDWTQQSNPYEAPESYVEDHYAPDYDPWAGRQLASRGMRLSAALIDGACGLVAALPAIVMSVGVIAAGGTSEVGTFVGLGTTALLMLGLAAYNLWRLYGYQQTVGKQIMKIQIVRSDLQTPVSFWRILGLRIIPMGLVGVIPLVGPIAQMVDPLLIFQGSQQCLHDLIADTNVVLFEE